MTVLIDDNDLLRGRVPVISVPIVFLFSYWTSFSLSQALGDPEFIPVDNEFLSVLGREVTLPNEFKDNYEHWLEREVFGSAIDWDCLLLPVKY